MVLKYFFIKNKKTQPSGSLLVGSATSRGTVMEVAVEVVCPGELRWRLSVAVAARRRRTS